MRSFDSLPLAQDDKTDIVYPLRKAAFAAFLCTGS